MNSVAVPEIFENGIQADATAYFGSVLTNSTPGTEVFHFRIFINLTRFDNDLGAVLTVMNRNNLVETIFKLSEGRNQKTFIFDNGIIAANASDSLPREIRLLGNRLVIYEDFVIYQAAPPPSLELPATLDFDMSIVAVSQFNASNSQSVRFAVGTVNLIPPPGEYDYINIILFANQALPLCSLHATSFV